MNSFSFGMCVCRTYSMRVSSVADGALTIDPQSPRLQVMAVAGLDSSRAHRLSPTRSTRSWATPPATPTSKDQSPYYTPLIRVDHPHRDSTASSHVSVRKSSWYSDDPEFTQRTYSPIHLQVPPEYHSQYQQKRGSATSLVEAASFCQVTSSFSSFQLK